MDLYNNTPTSFIIHTDVNEIDIILLMNTTVSSLTDNFGDVCHRILCSQSPVSFIKMEEIEKKRNPSRRKRSFGWCGWPNPPPKGGESSGVFRRGVGYPPPTVVPPRMLTVVGVGFGVGSYGVRRGVLAGLMLHSKSRYGPPVLLAPFPSSLNPFLLPYPGSIPRRTDTTVWRTYTERLPLS